MIDRNRINENDDLIESSNNDFHFDDDEFLLEKSDGKSNLDDKTFKGELEYNQSQNEEKNGKNEDDNVNGNDNNYDNKNDKGDKLNDAKNQTMKNISKYAINLAKNKTLTSVVIGLVVVSIAGIMIFTGSSSKEDSSTNVVAEVNDGFVSRENGSEDNPFEVVNVDPVVVENKETTPNELPQDEVETLNDNSLDNNDNEITSTSDDLFKEDDLGGATNGSIREIANSQIGIYRGSFTDRVSYVEAIKGKEVALKGAGVNPYGKKGSNNYLGNNPSFIAKNGKNSQVNNGGEALTLGSNHGTAVSGNGEKSIWTTNPDSKGENGENVVNPNNQNARLQAHSPNLKNGNGLLSQGSVIPAILFNEINSDFPSSVIAYVREDIYDSIEGYKLIIPRGTKLIGDVLPLNASSGNAGVEKVITIWNKLIMPNGYVVNLNKFRGIDLSGIDGMSGSVNRRILQKIGTGILSGVFEGGMSVVKALPDLLLAYYTPNFKEKLDKQSEEKAKALGEGKVGVEKAADSVMGTIGQLSSSVLNRPNTVTLPKGTRFNIVVNTDIELKSYYDK